MITTIQTTRIINRMKMTSNSRQLHGITPNRLLHLILFWMAAFNGWSISPLLCEPRAGDRMNAEVLVGHPVVNDTASIVDLSRTSGHGSIELGVWAPLPGDTLSRFYITLGNELKKVRGSAGCFYVTHKNKPGYTRRFTTGKPIGMTCIEKTNAAFDSNGLIDGISDYYSTGHYNLAAKDCITMITRDGDTIRNVVCVRTAVCDTLHFSESEPSLHKGIYAEWYAPGYRYPVLYCSADSIFDVEYNLADAAEKWYCISPETQEECIEDDRLNEEIRHAVAEEKNRPGPSQNSPAKTHGNTPPFIKWNADKTEITVTQTFSDSAFTEIILCDIHGRLYYSDKGDGTEKTHNISIAGFNPGVYLLYIGREPEPYVYQFTL